jgi:hypothetical protein
MSVWYKAEPVIKRLINNIVSEYVMVALFSFGLLEILLKVSSVRLFYSAGWPDPYIYTGYSINFAGLLERYGGTYYGARISSIFPAWLRIKLDIPTHEYRIILLVLISVCLYAILRIYSTRLNSFFIAMAGTNSVLFYRYVSDDYMPSYTVLYMLISMVCLARYSVSTRAPRFFLVLSGFGAGLAFNSNLSVVVMLIPWILTYLAFQKALRFSNKLLELRYMALGFLTSTSVCMAIGLLLGGEKTLLNYKASIGAVLNLKLYETLFTRPVSHASSFLLLYLLLFLFATVNILISAKESEPKISKVDLHKTNVIKSTTYSMIITMVCGVLYHVFASNAWFTWTFYAFLYIPIFLLPVLLLFAKRNLQLVYSCASIVITIFLLRYFSNPFSLERDQVSIFREAWFYLIIFSIFISVMIRTKFWKSFLAVCLLVSITIMPLAQDWNAYWRSSNQDRFDGEYLNFISKQGQEVNESTQFLAEEFAKLIVEKIPSNQYLWLTYPSRPTWLSSLDATQLWGYSCFLCVDSNGYSVDRSFPPTASSDWELLLSRKYTVIYSDTYISTSAATGKYLLSYPMAKLYVQKSYSFGEQHLFVSIVENF